MNNIIYLDNNATTKACDESKKAMVAWIQCQSNPSGISRVANPSKTLLAKSINYIRKHCSATGYSVVFTSGATEANCLIIRSIVDSWSKNVGVMPHVVSSSIEHSSIIKCLYDLANLNRIELTLIKPNIYGIINPTAVESSIKSNTCLITIMAANNEIGSINPISKIGAIAQKNKIPFHTDVVQVFGKYRLNLPKLNVDAVSMSYHKLYGPMGIGMLIVRDSLVKGYKLEAQISGVQQNGLRGGTENIPCIAGAMAGMVHNFHARKTKNTKLLRMRNYIIKTLSKQYEQIDYADFIKPTETEEPDKPDKSEYKNESKFLKEMEDMEKKEEKKEEKKVKGSEFQN